MPAALLRRWTVQSFGHDTRIGVAVCDVQVSDHDVGRDSGTCSLADPFNRTFKRETSPENPCPAARCPAVVGNVETMATHTGANGQGQRHPQTCHEEDSEISSTPLFAIGVGGSVVSRSRCLILRPSLDSRCCPPSHIARLLRLPPRCGTVMTWRPSPGQHSLATSECRSLFVSRQSAQLHQCATSRFLRALPMPNPLKVNGVEDAICTSDGNESMWRTLVKQ